MFSLHRQVNTGKVIDLRFDVSVEDAVTVHVLDGLQQLVYIHLNTRLGQVVRPAFNCFVKIHLHQLEHQGQSSRRLVTANSQ